MEEYEKYFSKTLSELLKNCASKKNLVGCSGAEVFHIRSKTNSPNAYLKISNSFEKMTKEAEIIKWLSVKISVPEFIWFEESNEYEFLLMSEIKGTPSYSILSEETIYTSLSKIAKAIKEFHAIDISNCPFDESMSTKMEFIERRIASNKVIIDNLGEENQKIGAIGLFKKIAEMSKNISEEFVFTHGDFCMPNILMNNDEVSGFIDLGRAGVSDKYQDLALFARSMDYNGFNKDHIKFFLDEYGLKEFDPVKAEFYKLMDLFY